MLPTTRTALRSILAADPTVAPGRRSQLMRALTTPPAAPAGRRDVRLLRRADVARTLGCSLRMVDHLAKSGTLRRVKFPGRVRGAGFRAGDVEALIQDGVDGEA